MSAMSSTSAEAATGKVQQVRPARGDDQGTGGSANERRRDWRRRPLLAIVAARRSHIERLANCAAQRRHVLGLAQHGKARIGVKPLRVMVSTTGNCGYCARICCASPRPSLPPGSTTSLKTRSTWVPEARVCQAAAAQSASAVRYLPERERHDKIGLAFPRNEHWRCQLNKNPVATR